MSTAQILLLGAIAGSTIFLGLPLGRMQSVPVGVKAFMSATATGILIFLLWDVLSGAVEPIESMLDEHRWGRFSWLAALGLAGFTLGLMSLVYLLGAAVMFFDLPSSSFLRRGFVGGGAWYEARQVSERLVQRPPA